MKILSLKLRDHIFQETEKILVTLKRKSRNGYINEAVEFYNRVQKRRLLEQQLRKDSELVAKESMEVLKEFDLLDDEV